MSRQTITWLIIAASFLLIGCIILGGAMTVLNWDFSKLSTTKFETNEYIIQEEYHHILVTTNTADITFVPSENEACSVVCFEQENLKHTAAVKNGTLEIRVNDTRKWYDHIGFHFRAPKITVYLPNSQYGTLTVKASTGNVDIPKDFQFESIDITQSTGAVRNYACASAHIKIKTTTGDICVADLSAVSLDLSVSTGKVTVSNVQCQEDVKLQVSTGKAAITDLTCQNLSSSGDTGSITLSNVIAKESFSIIRSTGSVKLDSCDAATLFIKTNTGNVTGTLLSDKVFLTQTDTGSIHVPHTTAGGKCEIITDTGNIKIEII